MAKNATIQAENREAARRKLIAYRAQCDIFEQLLKIVENAESRLVSVTAQYEETRSSSTARDTMGDQIATLNQQIEKLNAIIDRQAATLDEVLYLINALIPDNPTIARVMSKRYLEPTYEPTFKEIADEMGYSEDRIRHLHTEGLDLISDLISAA